MTRKGWRCGGVAAVKMWWLAASTAGLLAVGILGGKYDFGVTALPVKSSTFVGLPTARDATWRHTTTTTTTTQLVAAGTAAAAAKTRQLPIRQWPRTSATTTKTRLYSIVPVPDNFFTMVGFSLGITMTLYRNVNRGVQERAAWERRLEEGQGTDETDLEFLRRQSKVAYSEYGPDAAERNRPPAAERQRAAEWRNRKTSATTTTRPRMTTEEIEQFERDYGIRYDPYYDEPYEESELPDDVPYIVDKGSYGDVRYENGEIFYRDVKTGLYYRQGAKPRMRNVGIFYFPI